MKPIKARSKYKYCEKTVPFLIIGQWSNRISNHDNHDVIFENWRKVKISFHKRGIIRRHRCKGSDYVFKHHVGNEVVREHD